MLRLLRLLDLEQIRVVPLAAVDVDRALAEQHIVGRHILHLGDHRLAVLDVAVERHGGLEIVQDACVDAGMDHGRILVGRGARLVPTLGPGAIGVIHVPVPGFGQRQTLRGRQTKRGDIACEHEQTGEALAALDDAELGGLLDRVDGVATGVRQSDDLGLRGLRLQQERGEILRVERRAHLAHDLAAVLFDDRRRVALERVAEGIVGGEEEPSVAAGLDHRRSRSVRQHPGVIGPVDGVGIALGARQIGGGGAGDDERLVLVAGDGGHRERDARVRHVDDHVDFVDVVPLVGDVGADVRLVLMVAADEVDLDVGVVLGEIGDGELRRRHRTRAADVGIKARHVAQHADLDVDLLLRRSGTGDKRRRERSRAEKMFQYRSLHGLSSL